MNSPGVHTNDKSFSSISIDESHRPVQLHRVVLGYPDAATDFKFNLSLNYKLSAVIQSYSEQKPTLVVSQLICCVLCVTAVCCCGGVISSRSWLHGFLCSSSVPLVKVLNKRLRSWWKMLASSWMLFTNEGLLTCTIAIYIYTCYSFSMFQLQAPVCSWFNPWQQAKRYEWWATSILVSLSSLPLISAELIVFGVGFHHAGVEASDRKTVEALFTAGDLPVLCECVVYVLKTCIYEALLSQLYF